VAENVLKDKSAEVADVGVVIDRRPAGVHADAAGLERLELLQLAAERIVEAQHGFLMLRAHPTVQCAAAESNEPF